MITFPFEKLFRRTRVVPMDIVMFRLYLQDGLWCFDFPDKDITAEPFVDGIDVMLDRMKYLDAPTVDEPTLMFSTAPFTGSNELIWQEAEDRAGEPWNLYHSERLELSGWLCPCLLQFFHDPPPVIHFRLCNWRIDVPALTIDRADESSAYSV